MKKTRIFALVALSCIIGVIVITPVMGYPITAYTLATKDAHVYDQSVNTNYGGSNVLNIGGDEVGTGRFEAYIYFDLRNKPTHIIQIEFVIQVLEVQGTTNFSIHVVDDSWDESTITWSNKPTFGPAIADFIATSSALYIFQAPAIASVSEVSICIRTSEVGQAGRIQVTAREISTGYSTLGPSILWTYDGWLVMPGYDVALTIGIIGSVGVILAILMRKRLKITRK